jgi:hypothetical protein
MRRLVTFVSSPYKRVAVNFVDSIHRSAGSGQIVSKPLPWDYFWGCSSSACKKRATFFCPMLAKLSKLAASVLGPANVKTHFLVPRANWHEPRFRSPWSRVELGSKVGSN